MKRHIALLLSLAANAVLIGIVLRQAANHEAPASSSRDSKPETRNSKLEIAAVAQPKPSFDFGQWIRQSRDSGIPDDVLAELVLADFNNRWAQRQRDFDKRYWAGYENNASRMRFDQEHDAELERAMRSALGEAAFRAWDRKKVLATFNLDQLKLTAAEAEALYKLQKEWNRLNAGLQQKHFAGEIDDAEFDRQFAAAQANYEQQSKALLGDDRFAGLQQPVNTANADLRRSLGNLKVSDQDFDALLQANQQRDATRTELDGLLNSGRLQPAEYAARMDAAEAARVQAYRQVLGADNYAEYQKQQDSRYETLKRVAADWKLSASDVDYLYHLTHDYQASVDDYRKRAQMIEEQGQTVDWEAVQQNLQQFAQQTEQALRTYLGDDRFSKMNENNLLGLHN